MGLFLSCKLRLSVETVWFACGQIKNCDQIKDNKQSRPVWDMSLGEGVELYYDQCFHIVVTGELYDLWIKHRAEEAE